jgi:hypothetical protein
MGCTLYASEGGMARRLRLDDLYKMVAYIYREQNAQRSPASTLSHFVEVCGMLTIHDRRKKREGLSVVDALCKALGWYFPLLAKLHVRSVEDLVFRKYPYVCPYCRLAPHRDDVCKVVRGTSRTVDHYALKEAIRKNADRRPAQLNDWDNISSKRRRSWPEHDRIVRRDRGARGSSSSI